MRRLILTGTPGSGKTALLRRLELAGHAVVEPTAARRISFEEALAFERVHEETYRELGFTLTEVPAGPLEVRAARIRKAAGLG